MDTVKWKLKEFLDEHGVTAYKLSQQSQGRLSQTGVYRLTAPDIKAVRLESLATLIPALRELTGEDVDISDLLEYVGPPAPEPKKKAWRRLIGALEDPDGPTDIAERHDDYLAEIEWEEQQAGSLRGQR